MTDLSTSLTPSERARVHATAWTILGDTHAADDVAQELAIRLQEDPAADDPQQRSSWIARQALGLSLNQRRARVRRRLHEGVAGGQRAEGWVESPEWMATRAEDAGQVRDALAALEENQRSPLILRYFHGRRLNEIATILGVPLSTAHERIQRGLQSMRGRLRRTEVAPALIGLALPRATVLVAPVAVATRASVAVGTIYGLARAAVLAGLLGLAPQADLAQAESALDREIARLERDAATPHFVRPPRTPEVLIDPRLPDEPPVPPPGPEDRADPEGPRQREVGRTEQDRSESSVDGGAAGGADAPTDPLEGGLLGWVPETTGGRQAVDLGPATRPYSAPESMNSHRPEDGGDDDADHDSDNSTMGGGDGGGGGDDDGEGPGVLLGSAYGGATIQGNLSWWDGAAGARPLGEVHVQLLAAGGDDGFSPVAAAAVSDERGAFSLELPRHPGSYTLRVGVLDGDEFLPLPGGEWSQGATGAWTVVFDEPVLGTGLGTGL